MFLIRKEKKSEVTFQIAAFASCENASLLLKKTSKALYKN